eukprot:scaffold1966_cov109-Cylindrotheca_fusiformis.AAC.6
MMRADPYSYDEDTTRFSEDGVDSVLSRNEQRRRRHLYGADRRNVGGRQYNNDNNISRFGPQKTRRDDDSSKYMEEDALDSFFGSVEKGFGLDSSRGANNNNNNKNIRKMGVSRRNGYPENYDDEDDDDSSDEEKQPSHRAGGGRGSSDMDQYYLPTAASREMRSVDSRTTTNMTANNNNNGPPNVLAYILGGFGLCPPDQAGMDADTQVSHFQTSTASTGGANNSLADTKSKGGGGDSRFVSFCMPDNKAMSKDAQVSHFETGTRPEAREHGYHRSSLPPYEEKTSSDVPNVGLQETAAFPFNSRQFASTPERKRLDFEQAEKEQEEEERLRQQEQQEQLEQEKQLDAAIDPSTNFCAPPDCWPSEKKEEPETDEAFPPSNLPPPPSNAGGVDLESAMVRQDSLLDDEDGSESRLDQIRQKKRSIEQQVHSDLPSSQFDDQTTSYKSQATRPTGGTSCKNKFIISILITMFLMAAGLVAVSFFWPQLMPKPG